MTSALASVVADRYRVERELGRGGMATVYLAHDLKHDRQVAIKVLHEDLGATLGPERFLAEIKTTARLQHPHILPLLDSGSAGGLLFYVMPYVEGETLRTRLQRETQLPIEDAVRIAREVADALGFAHGHGIVHRDIKPENILLQGGHALVADFGIALAVQQAGGIRLTQTGLSIGTPQYMSPEQAMGERAVDARADQYALGAVTFEMLTGAPPFTGPTAQAIVARKLGELPPPVCVVRPAAGTALELVVRRALSPLPADRFDSMATYATALGEAVRDSGEHLVTPRPQPASGGGLAARVRGARAWRIVAVFASVVAIGAVGMLLGRGGRSVPSPSLLRVTIPTGPLALLGHARAPAVAISPDGRTLAYVAGAASEGQLMLRRMDAAAPTAVPAAAKVFGPFFSPDGEWLAWVDVEKGADRAVLRKMNLGNGAVFDLAPAIGMHGAAWTRDGRIVLGGTRQTGWSLSVIPEDGGSPEILVRRDSLGDEAYLVWPALTPDGDHIVFTALTGNGLAKSLELLDLRTVERRRLLEISDGRDGGGNVAITEDGVLVFAANGAIFGAELDVRRGRLTGQPVKLVPDVLMGFQQEPGLGHFALGRDGTLVYVAGDRRDLRGSEVVRWVDSARSEPVLSARSPVADGDLALSINNGLRFIPGTDLVVFSAPSESRRTSWLRWWESGEIWEARLGAERARRLAPPRTYYPVPSADGKWVFANLLAESAWSTSIHRIRRDEGGGMELVVEPKPGWMAHAYSLTRDGTLLMIHQVDTLTPPVDADIFAVRLDSAPAAREVLVGPGLDTHPAISPDGRWLAWTSGSLNAFSVVVAPYPSLSPRRRVTSDLSSAPAWSLDGSTLYYLEHSSGRIAAVSFSGNREKLFGAQRFVSGRRNSGALNIRGRGWDVDAMGRVHTTSDNSAADSVVARDLAVLANWGTTLRSEVRR